MESSRRGHSVSISLERFVHCMKHPLSREAVRTREASAFDVASVKFFAVPSVAEHPLLRDTRVWVGYGGMMSRTLRTCEFDWSHFQKKTSDRFQ